MAVDPAWEALRARVAAELATLQDGQFLVIGEPESAPGPPRGLFRRRTPPAPTRYVQFLRVGEDIDAECVGSTSFGGDLALAADVEGRLRRLGWKAPGESGESERGYPNFRIFPGPADPEELSRLCVDSLAVLGLAPGAQIELRRNR